MSKNHNIDKINNWEEIGLKVVSIEKAETASKCIICATFYPSHKQVYRYVPTINKEKGVDAIGTVIISGVEITLTLPELDIINVERKFYPKRKSTKAKEIEKVAEGVEKKKTTRKRTTKKLTYEIKEEAKKYNTDVEETIELPDNATVEEIEKAITDNEKEAEKATESVTEASETDTTEPLEETTETAEETELEFTADGFVKHYQYNLINTVLNCDLNVFLVGEAGTGKSTVLEQIARENGWQFFSTNAVQQEYKLTGFIDAGGNYHDTQFYRAATCKDECIFFIDEIDASIPEVLTLLNTAIANGYFEFPVGKVHFNKIHFVAAGNTVGSGADDNYTGRMVLDMASLDRFQIIDFDYDAKIETYLASGDMALVQFIRSMRKQAREKGIRAVFSYRAIIATRKLLDAKVTLENILKISVFKGMDKDTIRTFDVHGLDKHYVNAFYHITK